MKFEYPYKSVEDILKYAEKVHLRDDFLLKQTRHRFPRQEDFVYDVTEKVDKWRNELHKDTLRANRSAGLVEVIKQYIESTEGE